MVLPAVGCCAGAGADVRRMAQRVHGGRLDAGGRHALPHVLLVIVQRMSAGEIETPAVAGALLMLADLGVKETEGQRRAT